MPGFGFLRLVSPTGGGKRRNAPAGNYSDETDTPTQEKRIGGIFGGIQNIGQTKQLKIYILQFNTNPAVITESA